MKRIVLFLVMISLSMTVLFGMSENKVLMPQVAFKPSAILKNEKIIVDIKLGNKIYIYKKKLHFTIVSPKKVSLDSDLKFPKAVKYHNFIIYLKNFKQNIPLSLIEKKLGKKVNKIKLEVGFQGCSKIGLCYPPIKKEFTFNLKTFNLKNIQKFKHKSISKENFIAHTLAKSSIWVILITFFGFGLLLSLTPCIFPMIPILSSIIVSQSKENMNAKKGFFLSSVYVLSMSVAYTIAGILAGLFGENIQIFMQNPWVIGGFAVIFILLAFSMFGYYEIQLPKIFQSKINKTSHNAQGKGWISVSIMGFLSALIVGPCVAAPLAGALLYIGKTGNALLGGFALFVMSLGMGMPLLIVGIGAGKYMPKPGGWMQNISKIFGVIMLGVAIYMLSRVLSSVIIMFLWSFLFIGSSVYLGALEPLKEDISGILKLSKAIGIVFLLYGILLFVGAFLGNTNPLNPLENIVYRNHYTSNRKLISQKKRFIIVKNIKKLKEEINKSKKPVLVDFSANWCISCKELEAKTFNDPRVIKIFRHFTLIRADVTKDSKENKKLMAKYKVFGPPVILFFNKNHKFLKNKTIVGYIDANDFIGYLNKIIK